MHGMLRCIAVAAALLLLACASAAAATLRVDAPPALAADARRVEAVDMARLEEALARAGLEMPPRIDIVLVEETDRLARETPGWIVGLASGGSDVVIFPTRVVRYPYDSIESVVRHEVAHLALSNRAGGRPLPRWFHEGVAVSVDSGFGIRSQFRLLLAILDRPRVEDVNRLFQAMAQPESIDAYLLSAALVDDVRRQHGWNTPGEIARHVALGLPFDEAFQRVTGQSPDEAAARTWASYQRWVSWLPAATSGSAIWALIMVLALAAWMRRVAQRRRRRRHWDDEQEEAF